MDEARPAEQRADAAGTVVEPSEQELLDPGAPHRPGILRKHGFLAGVGISAFVADLLVAVLVSAFIIFFLYQPVRVEGTSMLPRLEDQDRLFIDKIAYRVGEIHEGDVVVFEYPRDHSKSYIKRVIALPGDRLRIDHGRVYVNDKYLPEPYVPARFEDDRSIAEMTLPPNEFWMMGDHRSISSDSRDFGPVDRSLIYGKAVFVYWPMEQVGVVH